MKIHKNETLQPRKYADAIRTSESFDETMRSSSEREPEKERIHRAIAKGALSLAEQRETERGEHDVDANIYRLVSHIDSFYENSVRLDELRAKYGNRNVPPHIRNEKIAKRAEVIEFNDALQETINAGASKFDFHELLHFMTSMRAMSSGPENLDDFHKRAKESLIGIRNEMAFEQVLIYAGVDYRVGTTEEDTKGGDFIVNGTPIDVKSSQFSAERAQQNAKRNGYDGSGIIWSHINFEDFDGKLMLPFEKCEAVWHELEPELAAATGSRQLAHA